jgi:hypothetical protein
MFFLLLFVASYLILSFRYSPILFLKYLSKPTFIRPTKYWRQSYMKQQFCRFLCKNMKQERILVQNAWIWGLLGKYLGARWTGSWEGRVKRLAENYKGGTSWWALFSKSDEEIADWQDCHVYQLIFVIRHLHLLKQNCETDIPLSPDVFFIHLLCWLTLPINERNCTFICN